MKLTLVKALIAALPAGLLLAGSATLFARKRTLSSLLMPVGAGGLMVVILTHVCEGLRFFPWMRWGEAHSWGHYLDLSGAVLGVTLLPFGYWLHRRERVSSAASP